MAKRQYDEQLLQLMETVLSGTADEAQVRQLEQLLDHDPEVCQLFAHLSQLDVDLRYTFRTGSGQPVPQQVARSSVAVARQSDRLVKHPWAWAIAIAASIALLLAMPGQQPTPADPSAAPPQVTKAESSFQRPPAPVATLASQDGAVWKNEHQAIGQVFREGQTAELLEGEARISVGCGAEIALRAPCALKFVALDKVELEHGDVAVHVAEWAKGFSVVTDGMEVVDLGTTFTVSASKEKGVQTEVIQGLVRVHPKVADQDRRGMLVSEGNGYAVDPLGRGNALQQATESLFETTSLSKLHLYRPINLSNTGVGFDGVGFAEGDEDPHWQVVGGPDAKGFKARYAVVCVPDERYLPNDKSSSQWISMPGWRTAEKNSVYTFRSSFQLDGYDLKTIQLFGRFLADNGIHAVRINGTPVKVESWSDNEALQEFDHSQFRFVNVTDGLVAGMNVVEIDVWNGHFAEPAAWRDRPNPMALRVEWYAFGRQSKARSD